MVLIRSVTIFYFLYFYLTGAGVVPDLTVTATASLCTYSLCRLLTLLIATTILSSK
jgi:hypothetical protein